MNETWIILGATSGIGRAFARKISASGAGLILAGRDMADIEATAGDCVARGARFAEAIALDIRDASTFTAILERAGAEEGSLNAAVFVGSMPEQEDIDKDPSLIAGTVIDSFSGPAEFLTALAPMLEERGQGTIVGIGSVAGDRGRLGNYVYGAAKAGFHTYMAGLRNRLGRSDVHVMTVKPGPVDTAMTWGLGALPLMTTPEAVADDILKGVKKQRNVIYSAKIWWLVMLILKLIPERVFKKLSI